MSELQVVLRPWRPDDKESLVRYANNRRIWMNLRDRFPHPYSEADAEIWLARSGARKDRLNAFAIDVAGEAVGGIGFDALRDVHRIAAEVGFWVAEPFWGKGIATSAVKQLSAYAFANFPLERLQATVFEWNAASARVLEKAGYTLEGRLRRHVLKEGRVGDSLLYARLRTDEMAQARSS
jgi:ribosomal-protein-alanine N-acetyltransferase